MSSIRRWHQLYKAHRREQMFAILFHFFLLSCEQEGGIAAINSGDPRQRTDERERKKKREKTRENYFESKRNQSIDLFFIGIDG